MKFVHTVWIWLGVCLIESWCQETVYFAGGTIHWRPLETPTANEYRMVIEPRLSWAGGSSSQESSNCYQNGWSPYQDQSYHVLVTRNRRSSLTHSVLFRCSDYNVWPHKWSAMEGKKEVVTPDAEVTITFTSNTCAYKESETGCGILLSRANLAVRPDTGTINTPPLTNMLTWVQLDRGKDMVIRIPGQPPSNPAACHDPTCLHKVKVGSSTARAKQAPMLTVMRIGSHIILAIDWLVWDADGDIVRCRWATSFNYECDSFCSHFQEAALDENACTLTYRALSASCCQNRVVSLQIEDFSRSNPTIPLSSTPLQFIVNIVNQDTTQRMVEFSASTVSDGSLFFYGRYQATSLRISAFGTDICVSHINSVTTLGFYVYKSASAINAVAITWNWYFYGHVWTYSTASDQFACFQTISCEGVTASEVRCIHLQDTYDGTSTTESTSTPSTSTTETTSPSTSTTTETTSTTATTETSSTTNILCVTQSVTRVASSVETTQAANEGKQTSVDQSKDSDMLPIVIGTSVGGAVLLAIAAFFLGLFAGKRRFKDAAEPDTRSSKPTNTGPGIKPTTSSDRVQAPTNTYVNRPESVSKEISDAGPDETYEELNEVTLSPTDRHLYSNYTPYYNN